MKKLLTLGCVLAVMGLSVVSMANEAAVAKKPTEHKAHHAAKKKAMEECKAEGKKGKELQECVKMKLETLKTEEVTK